MCVHNAYTCEASANIIALGIEKQIIFDFAF